MKKPIFTLLLVANIASAQTTIKAGTPAPYDGVLFDNASEQKLRDMALENEAFVKKFAILNDQNTMLDSQVKIWKDQSLQLSKEVYDSRKDSNWRFSGGFLAGAIVTVVLAMAVKGATTK